MLAAALPGPCGAGTARVTSGTLEYAADVGEANDVEVTHSPDAYHVTDLGAIVTPGSGCSSVTSNQVECPRQPIDRLVVNVRDLNDFVTVSGSLSHTASRRDRKRRPRGG